MVSSGSLPRSYLNYNYCNSHNIFQQHGIAMGSSTRNPEPQDPGTDRHSYWCLQRVPNTVAEGLGVDGNRQLTFIRRCHHNQHTPKASQLVVTARNFSKVEESDCFVNEAWYSTPQWTKAITWRRDWENPWQLPTKPAYPRFNRWNNGCHTINTSPRTRNVKAKNCACEIPVLKRGLSLIISIKKRSHDIAAR